MSNVSAQTRKSYEAFKEHALEKNYKSYVVWSKYKYDVQQTKTLLMSLPEKISHSVMVPIGTKGMMQGMIVHTNEFLVNLGETWFSRRSAHETLKICDRRIENCSVMLEKLERERELLMNKLTLPAKLDAFGNEQRPEIIEYVTDTEINKWKEQHKIKEKEYREKLTELKNKKKFPIKTEEELWRRLDELELQEELEDELNRLDGGLNHDEELPKCSKQDSSELSQIRVPSDHDVKKGLFDKAKRKVSFACDVEDPLRLEIKHSAVKPGPSASKKKEINSPSDIYDRHFCAEKNLQSLLKINENSNKKREHRLDSTENDESPPSSVQDIKERQSVSSDNNDKVEDISKSSNKKVSKFKKYRSRNFSQ